ncbi:MAG: acylphosphatase [Ignavibacteria bacterium]|nr:acylphosphatase [Ignavibacteria bacterium]
MSEYYKVRVNGMVQGVGYRYFCKRKALEYNISGFVKNLFSGEVVLEIEGNSGMIIDFLTELKRGPIGSYVKEFEIEKLPFENKFSSFEIL